MKKMRNKLKYIVFIVLGIIVGGIISTIAANVISANQVGYSNDKTTKTNIKDALDELYEKTNKPENTSSIWKYEGVKAIIYLDPTDLSKECNANNSVSTTGTKTGCMKWYAYAENDTTYTMILDHNTTAYSYFNYNSLSDIGTRSASELTSIAGKTISYNEIGYDLAELTSTSGWGWVVTPRMIDIQEIGKIIGYTSCENGSCLASFYFDTYTTDRDENINYRSASKYGWLFDNLADCESYGCNINQTGATAYWTTRTQNNAYKWRVAYKGWAGTWLSNNWSFGLRPVITVNKSDL